MPCTVAWTVPPGILSRSDMRPSTATFSSALGWIGSSGPPGATTTLTNNPSCGYRVSISSVLGIPICTPITPSGYTTVLRSGTSGTSTGAFTLRCIIRPSMQVQNACRVLVEDASLCLLGKAQRRNCCRVELDRFRHRRPVGPEDVFGRLTHHIRKVIEQPPGHEPGHVDVHVRLVRGQEATHVVPEAAATMRHHQCQLRKIDRHIIEVDRVTILDPRPRNHRAADVHQHRDAC